MAALQLTQTGENNSNSQAVDKRII